MGKIFYIIGKSASGKDCIYKRMMCDSDMRLLPLVLYTTRPIRDQEVPGKEYNFVNEEEIKRLRSLEKIIEERSYHTVYGIWTYATVDDGNIDLEQNDYVGIGTLESYMKIKKYFGKDSVCPIYIEVEDGIRLERALQREREQKNPRYAEMCRRFLADNEDFKEEHIREAGIIKRFQNNGDISNCLNEIHKFIGSRRKTL